VQWTFSSSVQMKMLDRFRAGLSADLVGLPLREQMRLTRYGIRVGNIFTTPLHFTKLWVERTSAGIRILFVDQDRAGLGRSLVAVQSGFRR
ncbi:MAG: hypothetical protein GWO19_17115, partial [Nitrospinaceae bacterium]|nr:hypothetical protein [Nitrospinaceae bacterium]NIT83349.1 hypothetical protein [Nitrospinaceae bacterium]